MAQLIGAKPTHVSTPFKLHMMRMEILREERPSRSRSRSMLEYADGANKKSWLEHTLGKVHPDALIVRHPIECFEQTKYASTQRVNW